MKPARALSLLAVAGAACLAMNMEKQAANARQPKPRPMVLPRHTGDMVIERIARQIIAASPMADPADAKARDEASKALGEIKDLIDAGGSRVLWGGYNPAQGYDPEAYRLIDTSDDTAFQLTELSPAVWARLYLSTFMFKGPYEIRKVGGLTVLELDVQFRAGLDAGEYPYPFWHTPNKWTAYVNAHRIAMVFSAGKLVSAMRVSPDPLSLKLIRREWDARWQWTDANGDPQPRVTLYSYIFSTDNPHVPGLDASYRALEAKFRENNCLQCHEPDNRSRINDLLLLNYPNQALVARRSLVAVLEENSMPPGNEIAHEPTGIQDEAARGELIRLAREFEKQADAAFAFERSHASQAGPAGGPANP